MEVKEKFWRDQRDGQTYHTHWKDFTSTQIRRPTRSTVPQHATQASDLILTIDLVTALLKVYLRAFLRKVDRPELGWIGG